MPLPSCDHRRVPETYRAAGNRTGLGNRLTKVDGASTTAVARFPRRQFPQFQMPGIELFWSGMVVGVEDPWGRGEGTLASG